MTSIGRWAVQALAKETLSVKGQGLATLKRINKPPTNHIVSIALLMGKPNTKSIITEGSMNFSSSKKKLTFVSKHEIGRTETLKALNRDGRAIKMKGKRGRKEQRDSGDKNRELNLSLISGQMNK